MNRSLVGVAALLAATLVHSVLLAQAPTPEAAANQPPQGRGGAPAGGRQGGFVAYPQRPPGDPAAIARGKGLYGVNCTFCHGPDGRGGDGGGPNLLRSTIVLTDQRGERIGPVIVEGRGSMPKFQLMPDQIGDIAEFLHSFPVGSRTAPTEVNILVGDAKKGEAYVAAKCRSCHMVDALRTFALKLDDPKWLQQMWLMPGSGAGRGGGTVPIPAPPVTASVTLPSGEKIEGKVRRIDDFSVSLALDNGTVRSFRTAGTNIKVALHDPLQPHKTLLPQYADSDIHNVTAYLSSLRQP